MSSAGKNIFSKLFFYYCFNFDEFWEESNYVKFDTIYRYFDFKTWSVVDGKIELTVDNKIVALAKNKKDMIKKINNVLNYNEGMFVEIKKGSLYFDNHSDSVTVFNVCSFDEAGKFLKSKLNDYNRYNFLMKIEEGYFSLYIVTPHVDADDYYFMFGENNKDIVNVLRKIQKKYNSKEIVMSDRFKLKYLHYLI